MHVLSLVCTVLCSAAAPWRTYEVYRPTITRHTVVDGDVDELNYNHGSAIAWFRGRWYCLWNANRIRNEGKPGQLIYQSTSPDGRRWSKAVPAFADASQSANPVPCPKGVQWQPNLIVVGDELWAAWSQLSKDRHYGCYLSRLARPDGKWHNRRLLWDSKPDPTMGGKRWRVLPLSAPMQLSAGRILVPVTLMARRADDAPPEEKGWFGLEKRSSVLYTDDRGETWHASPGAVQPGRSWAQWEPTVWELADGTVMMFARNQAGGRRPEEALLWSKSDDGGATWTPHRRVPLRTAVSRMHVVPGGGDRFLMAHNDWPACELMGRRYNLALFFTRGAGIDFVAGPGYSGVEPAVAYPCVHIRGDAAVVSYSAGHPPRAIMVARIAPLPSPGRHYLFPRTNVPAPPRPIHVGPLLRFAGRQSIVSRRVLDPGPDGLSAGAWVMAGGMTLVDTRQAEPRGGFVWGMKQTVPFVHLATPEGELRPSLRLPWHEWSYVGMTVDARNGDVTFFVNDEAEIVRFTAPPPHPLPGANAHVGDKAMPASRLSGLDGVLRGLAVYPSARFGREEHNWLRNAFAEAIGQPAVTPARRPAVEPALWLDPSDAAAMACDFTFPEAPPRGVETAMLDGAQSLRFVGECSTGVDLDTNRRDSGDRVELRFAFRVEAGDGQTLATVGDADVPARVVARDGQVWLTAGDQKERAGPFAPADWTGVHISTVADRTELSVGDGPAVAVRHRPVATWLYLGEGYPPNGIPDGSRFVVSVPSVRSRVVRPTAGAVP